MGQWIDGSAVAQEIQSEVAEEVLRLRGLGVHPGLAVMLVGENPASQIYVRSKVKMCQTLGMHSEKIELPASSSTRQLVEVVEDLNGRADIHGILVQLPLPAQVDSRRVLEAVLPEKDVDGLHPVNVGRLVAGGALLKACTPAGIMEILNRCRIQVRGRRAVVIGRSDIVGKPVSLMLMHQDATVTVCHSKTADLPGVAREADILIVAMGKPAFVDDTFVKPGAAVIDVGTNRVESLESIRALYGEDPKRLADHAKKGYTLVGDVDQAKVLPICSYLTPVPGGVGPLTIAMLMANTVKAAAALSEKPAFILGGGGIHP
ncbi:MAG TPA: bifunctional 5,10-methylenetetrahydrofolate dehydrogenase/5,10-methenyltetrahydrofolate cyclohydrolase [Acidobacteriota bacterium]|nr:bifunctional 5,10-methylenetetrahydrofolate dehydrogenase/5,10-methenyltetrahydrofolate cyclohydrolase [Acidobacteriota bacterium]